MKHGYIKAAAASFALRLVDPAANARSVIDVMKTADKEGINLLVFPELCITGASCGELFMQKLLIDKAEAALRDIISESTGLRPLTFVGLPVRIGGKLYNVAAAISDGKLLGISPKENLVRRGGGAETAFFSPAPTEPKNISVCGFTVPFGKNIIYSCSEMESFTVSCEISNDLLAVIPPSSRHALLGANITANLSAICELTGSDARIRSAVAERSARCISAYIYSSAGEGESTTDTVCSGHAVIAERGNIIGENPPFGKSTLTCAVIDLEHIVGDRMKSASLDETDAEAVSAVFSQTPYEIDISGTIDAYPFIPKNEQDMKDTCRRIINIQAHGLAARLRAAHSSGAAVAISGGLDSCLALLVTARAFDLLGLSREKIRTITMPCFGTTSRTRSNAEILSRELGTSFSEINIASSVRQHFCDIGHSEDDHNVVYENSQARERTQVLMDIANETGALAIGTGDLSEIALGWATYNGDHMSNYGVNGGIPKTLIRHVVAFESAEYRAMGSSALADAIDDILNTPVSPELLPAKDGEISQKTEDIVGPYELHDFFIYRAARYGDAPDKILRAAKSAFDGIYDESVIRAWLNVFLRRFFTQQFKRSCMPDGPKVGEISFSPRGDFKMPSDAVNTAWLDSIK